MNRVNRRIPCYSLAIAAVLAAGIAQASSDVAGTDPVVTPAASGSLAVVWDELIVGGDKKFNTFIQGNSVSETANGGATPHARPAPSLLWFLGAGIIGLATVARRRSL